MSITQLCCVREENKVAKFTFKKKKCALSKCYRSNEFFTKVLFSMVVPEPMWLFKLKLIKIKTSIP